MGRCPHESAPVPLTSRRIDALWAALTATLGRPLRFLPLVLATALVLATLLTGALVLWRLQPLEAPPWVRPQALVLAAGAEGETDLAALGLALRKVNGVLAADFIGRDAALADLAQRPGLASLGLRELRPNPLPDAFVVTFSSEAGPEGVEAAAAELAKVKAVDSVHYQPDAFRRLWALARLGRRLVLLAGAALVAALVLGMIAAAAVPGRPDPAALRLFDMLGADRAMVRRPYVYAGAIEMLAAAALAVWLTFALAARLDPLIADLARQYALHWSTDAVPAGYGAALCAAAALLGGLLASLWIRLAQRAASTVAPGLGG